MGINSEGKESQRKNQFVTKQMRKIEKQEERILNKKENMFLKTNVTPVVDKIQTKIPVKLKEVLNTAFYKGFQLVFEKGNTYIEKTYNKDKIQLGYDLNNYAFDKYQSKKHIMNMDKQSNLSTTLNSTFAVLEGGALGLLGIGLPDIPLFIAVIIRTINEIALSYGYRYDTNEEKIYLLSVIAAAMSKGGKQKEYDSETDQLGEQIDLKKEIDLSIDAKMKDTADILSDALLTAKFIQGIPVVGAVGGVVNHIMINKIGRYAKIKYKKRYLQNKLRE